MCLLRTGNRCAVTYLSPSSAGRQQASDNGQTTFKSPPTTRTYHQKDMSISVGQDVSTENVEMVILQEPMSGQYKDRLGCG